MTQSLRNSIERLPLTSVGFGSVPVSNSSLGKWKILNSAFSPVKSERLIVLTIFPDRISLCHKEDAGIWENQRKRVTSLTKAVLKSDYYRV